MDKASIVHLNELYEDSRSAKQKRMQQIIYNLRMSAGDQQIWWNNQLRDYERANWEKLKQPPLITFNMLKNFNRACTSRLISVDPQMSVIAATTDPDDLQAARGADRYRERIEMISHHGEAKIKLGNLIVQTGRAYDFSYPDVKFEKNTPEPEIPEAVTDLPTLALELPEEEVKVPEPIMEPVDADIRGEVLTAIEVFGPPGIEDDDDWPWVIVEKVRPLAYIRKKYNLPEDAKLLPDDDEQELHNLDSLIYKNAEKKKDTVAAIRMYYEKPGPDNDNLGRFMTWCGSEYLGTEQPWPFDFLPITGFLFDPLPGSHWAKCPVDDAIPIQKLYNMVCTMIVHGAKLVAMPKLLVPTECDADIQALESNAGGEIVTYSNMLGEWAKPGYLTGAIGQDLYKIRDNLLQDMETCYGLHGASMGDSPTSRTPAELYSANIEQDNSKFKIVTDLWVESWRKVTYKRIRMAQEYLPEDKLFRLLGRNGQVEAHSFKAADLSEGFDIAVVPGTGEYKSKAAQMQKILMLAQNQMLPRDPSTGQLTAEVWDAMDMADVKPMQEQLAGAVRQARIENQKMDKGIYCPTFPAFDHFTHHAIHQVDINSPAFLDYPPEIQKLKGDHLMSHVPQAPESVINSMIPGGGTEGQQPPPQGEQNATPVQ